MNNEPFVIEQVYNAPIGRVWSALTDNDKMRQWYFQLEEFKPEVGFEFSFNGGSKEKQYVHLCRITAVEPQKKLAYTWRYQDYPGNSEVTFELFPEDGGKTRLRLTHAGLETFPNEKDFALESFSKGWTYITGTSLKGFVEA